MDEANIMKEATITKEGNIKKERSAPTTRVKTKDKRKLQQRKISKKPRTIKL